MLWFVVCVGFTGIAYLQHPQREGPVEPIVDKQGHDLEQLTPIILKNMLSPVPRVENP